MAIWCQTQEYIFTPDPIENLYPILIATDSETGADGPFVEIECNVFIFNDNQIYLNVYCRVREWPVEGGNGATEGIYQNVFLIYTAPTGKTINAITSSVTSTASYIDNDVNYDIIPYTTEIDMTFVGELVDRFKVLGDTNGGYDVAPGGNCPDDDACTELNIYFNEMAIELINE